MSELPEDLLQMAWELIHDCESFEDFSSLFYDTCGSKRYYDVELKIIWNEHWGRLQEGCPDCDH